MPHPILSVAEKLTAIVDSISETVDEYFRYTEYQSFYVDDDDVLRTERRLVVKYQEGVEVGKTLFRKFKELQDVAAAIKQVDSSAIDSCEYLCTDNTPWCGPFDDNDRKVRAIIADLRGSIAELPDSYPGQ